MLMYILKPKNWKCILLLYSVFHFQSEQEKLCKCPAQFSVRVQRCTDDLLFKHHQTLSVKQTQGKRTRPTGVWWVSDGQRIPPSRWPVLPAGLFSVWVCVLLVPPSSSFWLTFKIYPGEKLFRSHTHAHIVRSVRELLVGVQNVCAAWMSYFVFVCIKQAPYLHLPSWPGALCC